jgi:hypothetical protein
MRQGGVFRLLVPDLEVLAAEYLRKLQEQDATANTVFLENAYLGEKARERGLAGLTSFFLGNSKHRWMWDALSMSHALKEHGFTQVRKCAFGDSADPMFGLVEDRGRFERAVAIEARR